MGCCRAVEKTESLPLTRSLTFPSLSLPFFTWKVGVPAHAWWWEGLSGAEVASSTAQA